MTDAVPAPVALAWLASLSADLRTAVVLDAAGGVVAGDAGLASAVTALLDGAAAGEVRRRGHGEGTLHAARSGVHALGLLAGPHALAAVVAADLLAALADLHDC